MAKKSSPINVWIFIALVFIISLSVKYLSQKGINIPLSTIPILVGLSGFIFWVFACRKPIIEIYSLVYPYKKLKLWAALSAFMLFEYILAWGLHTKQLELVYEHFYSIIVIFIGVIAFYFSFVRMKVSLRYLFLAIFIPFLALGSAVGLGKYFGFIHFSTPQEDVAGIVFLNAFYWAFFYMLYQLICEEPAFRGFLMQRLMDRGRTQAVIISSFIFAIWHMVLNIFEGAGVSRLILSLPESFITGCFLALLFVKGKNLLIAAISHGIIIGLKISLFAGNKYPGLSQYFKITGPAAESKFIILWLGCLLVGTILVLITPEKRKPQIVFHKVRR